jgi:PhnB protein
VSVRLTPYLILDGTVKEALQFYEQALEGQLMFSSTFGEMPENPDFPLPEEAKSLIAHAMMRIGDSDLMFSDAFPGQPVQKGNSVTICITSSDASKSRQLFEALSQGGQVSMPLQETSFSPAYGMVIDKYGINFHIYTEGGQQQ